MWIEQTRLCWWPAQWRARNARLLRLFAETVAVCRSCNCTVWTCVRACTSVGGDPKRHCRTICRSGIILIRGVHRQGVGWNSACDLHQGGSRRL
ncbi:hypothetical protein BJV74DRAFT_861930 [Russula compacta]|nr:hypothetical protein BJV74DRAFT_861930 [Russula compacta]